MKAGARVRSIASGNLGTVLSMSGDFAHVHFDGLMYHVSTKEVSLLEELPIYGTALPTQGRRLELG